MSFPTIMMKWQSKRQRRRSIKAASRLSRSGGCRCGTSFGSVNRWRFGSRRFRLDITNISTISLRAYEQGDCRNYRQKNDIDSDAPRASIHPSDKSNRENGNRRAADKGSDLAGKREAAESRTGTEQLSEESRL